MTPASRTLDLTLLEKVRSHASGKVTARCPACAESGGDRAGNHLVLFPDDRFACAAHAGDHNHRKRIFAIIGIRSDFQPCLLKQRRWHERRTTEHRQRLDADRLASAARLHRQSLLRRFAWKLENVREESPQKVNTDLVKTCPRHFLASLFNPSDLLWTGAVHHSGSASHAQRWRNCQDWQTAFYPIGPMTTPAVWKAETYSRAAGNVLASPYTVLDFDGFDGIKPSTPDNLSRHILDSLALIRWLKEGMDWQLAAILWTGGKSLHAWFHTPHPEVLNSLKPVASTLGMDAGLIGRAEHPCRLPGQLHEKSGNLSSVVWLQSPNLDGLRAS